MLFLTGIANTIGRVLCGWVSDRPWADPLLINNIALMVGGAATVASPFCTNYGMFATYAALFGLGIGKSQKDDVIVQEIFDPIKSASVYNLK